MTTLFVLDSPGWLYGLHFTQTDVGVLFLWLVYAKDVELTLLSGLAMHLRFQDSGSIWGEDLEAPRKHLLPSMRTCSCVLL